MAIFAVRGNVDARADRSSIETTKTHVRWLDRRLSGVELAAIGLDRIETIAAAKRAERRTVKTRDGVKELPGTVSTAP